MNWLGLNGVLNEWSPGYRATEVRSLKSDVRPLTSDLSHLSAACPR
jgi:hypothetical protein